MKRTIIITAILAVAAIITIIAINRASAKKELENLYAEVQRGQFDIIVTTTGELQAERSTDIFGPELAQSRNIRAADIKITDLVPEGTEVKEGDYIATLDRTSFDNSLKDELERLTTYETNLEVKILDTAVTLSNLRDNIKNQNFSVEEARITLEQSKFEPPTTIRQAEIALDKASRSLDQSVRGYSLRVEQARSDMRNQRNQLAEQRQRVADLQNILSKFVIKAPSAGMVIYKRDRTGTKRKVGSSISTWDNVVATLPDMTSMISKTYVNEVDVSKVKANQKVEIIVDAFPDKKYSGSIISVANIGEQLPNADAKVFEVLVKVDGTDLILRPSMTTGNKIITNTIPDVIYIPLESVQTGADSIPFVYKKNHTKQIVVLGESNENNVIVEQGLAEGEMIYLNTPKEPETITKIQGEELISVIKEKDRIRREEERRINEEAKAKAQQNNMGAGMRQISPEMMQQFQNMRGGATGEAMPGGAAPAGAAGAATQGRQMPTGEGGNFQGGQGRQMDTAAMRRFQQMRNSGQRDTSARRMPRTAPAGQEGGEIR